MSHRGSNYIKKDRKIRRLINNKEKLEVVMTDLVFTDHVSVAAVL